MGRNMKNKIKTFAIILGILGSCLMFASFSPSLDGRAVVVDQGVFPQGLFAKTVGYLPGDIISVANITGDSTVDLLVIGALDPSDGIAIMLSPEAAAAIGISKDDSNIVKITKRNGQNERVYGTAVIAKQNQAPETSELNFDIAEEDAFSEDFEEEEDILAEEDSAEAENLEKIPEAAEEAPLSKENEEIAEDFEEEAFEEEAYNEEAEEEAFEEEEAEESVPEEEALEEAPFETITAAEDESEEEYEEENIDEQFEDSELAEEAVENEADEAEESDEENWTAEDALSEEEAVEEEPLEEEPVENELDDLPSSPIVEEMYEEESPAPAESPVEEAEETEEEAEAELVTDYVPEDKWEVVIPDEVWNEEEYAERPLNEEIEDEIPAKTPYEEEDAFEGFSNLDKKAPADEEEDELSYGDDYDYEDEEGDSDEYAAIVLVPLDQTPAPEPAVVEENEEEPEVEEESPASVVLPIPSPAPVDESESYELTDNSYSKYMVDSLSDLKSSSYYIQIATLSVDENIMEIVNKYSANYPITIVPLASGARKQVLIGPLNMDEYAVVLQRFKAYGYKDAFLRKIK